MNYSLVFIILYYYILLHYLKVRCTTTHCCQCVSGGFEWSRQGQSHLEKTNAGIWSSDHWLLCAVQEKGKHLLHLLSAWL